MINLDIKADITDIENGLIEMEIEIPKASNKLRNSVTNYAKNRVRANMGNYLRTGSGSKFTITRKGKNLGKTNFLHLRERVYGYSRGPGHSVVAAPRYIAEPLERGATFGPKKAKHLFFVGATGYHRMECVTIPARHWFSQSLGNVEGSSEVAAALRVAEENIVRKFNEAKTGSTKSTRKTRPNRGGTN